MKRRILLLLLTVTLLFSGCTAGGGKNNNTGGGGKVVPEEGGVLNLSSYSPDTLNPLSTQYSSVRDFLHLIYEGLFIVNEDLSAKCVLASDYSASEGNTVYTVNLVKGIKFHDGSAFTAADVIATFEYIQTNDTIYTENLSNVASYSSNGDYSVVIVLKSPQANFVNNLDFPILPSGISKTEFSVPNNSFTPIGTGRYVFSSMNPYTGIELLKNGEWRDSAKVYIPKVSIRFVKDNDNMLYAFDSGETDIITTQRARWGEYSYTGKFKTGEVTTTKYTFMGLNTKSSVFADVEIRRLISDAIDKELLTDSLFFSHAAVAQTPISSKAHFAKNDEKASAKKKDFSALKEKKLTFYLMYNEESQQKQKIAEYIKDRLKEAGVKVVLSRVDFQTYTHRIKTGNYNAYIGEIDMSRDCDLRFLFNPAVITSDAPKEDNSPEIEDTPDAEDTPNADLPAESEAASWGAVCDFTSSDLDSLIKNMNTAVSKNDMSVAYNNFENYFKTYVPHIPLFHINDAVLVNNRIKGEVNKNLTNFYADLGNIYIKYKKE